VKDRISFKTVYRSRQRQPEEPDKKKDKKPFHQFVVEFFNLGSRGDRRSSIVEEEIEEESSRVAPEVEIVHRRERIFDSRSSPEARSRRTKVEDPEEIRSKRSDIIPARRHPRLILLYYRRKRKNSMDIERKEILNGRQSQIDVQRRREENTRASRVERNQEDPVRRILYSRHDPIVSLPRSTRECQAFDENSPFEPRYCSLFTVHCSRPAFSLL
jgi:hypothetical protein